MKNICVDKLSTGRKALYLNKNTVCTHTNPQRFHELSPEIHRVINKVWISVHSGDKRKKVPQQYQNPHKWLDNAQYVSYNGVRCL